MGWLYGVTVDIEAASTMAKFEVIEIVDNSNPYLVFLGIDWAIDMNGVINLKKMVISFERKSLRVIVPLDPTEGVHYTEPVHDSDESDDELDHIYKIITQDQVWINPTVDGWISLDRESSCTSDSNEALEHWHNRLREVSTLRCNMMMKSLCCVSS